MLNEKARNKRVLEGTSFIATVYNEASSIRQFLGSLMDQTVLPSEIVIVDGGSEDNTFGVVEEFFRGLAGEAGAEGLKIYYGEEPKNKKEGPVAVRLIKKAGAGISMGRNTAIINSSGRFISASDAGCILDPRWLEEINSGMDASDLKITGGMNYPLCRSFLQALLALCIMPGLNEVKRDSYMPSSRNICFRKAQWEKVEGYPQYLDYGEDMKFNFNLKEKGYEVIFNPDAVVYWKMRNSLKDIFRQFFRYAKGDALGRMYPIRHFIRFFSGLIFAAIVFTGIFINHWIFLMLIVPAVFYCHKQYYRLFLKWDGNEKCRPPKNRIFAATATVPLLLIYIDIAKASGYIYGLYSRRNVMKSRNFS
jgi:glycosyltransferase involved in cell wall biosynthesis